MLKTTSLVIGTIIGAGFVSGREIISFFGGGNIFLSALYAFIAFFIITYLLLETGRKYKTLQNADKALFGKADKTVNFAVFICLFAVAAAGVATVDSLASSLFGIPKNAPVFSVLFLLAAYLCSKKGLGGITAVNALLVPIMLLMTAGILIFKGGFDFSSGGGADSPVIYVSFNMFLSANVVTEAGGNLSRKNSFLSSLISALVTAAFIVLIYGAVNFEGVNAVTADLPLFYAASFLGKGVSLLFAVILMLGAFTTLVSAFYPLGKGFVSVLGSRGDITAFFAVFMLSRFGIKNIVGYGYPAAGVMGLVFFFALAAFSSYKSFVKRK